MVASAMFYGREAGNSDKQGKLEIGTQVAGRVPAAVLRHAYFAGPIQFSVQQLIVSVQSSLIVIPVNILIVQVLFGGGQ